jgi:hypothetical protein
MGNWLGWRLLNPEYTRNERPELRRLRIPRLFLSYSPSWMIIVHLLQIRDHYYHRLSSSFLLLADQIGL